MDDSEGMEAITTTTKHSPTCGRCAFGDELTESELRAAGLHASQA